MYGGKKAENPCLKRHAMGNFHVFNSGIKEVLTKGLADPALVVLVDAFGPLLPICRALILSLSIKIHFYCRNNYHYELKPAVSNRQPSLSPSQSS